jgi:hypothetical protein
MTELTPPRRLRTARATAAGLALAGGLLGASLLSACNDTSDAATTDTTEIGTGVPAHEHGPLVVEATDYAFAGLPDSVPAGTRLQLRNDSAVELHELVAFRLPEGETRSVEELVHDPSALPAEPATVLLAPPGAEEITAAGDGTLTEPGRYVLLCAIPTGISPQEYLDAVAAAGGQKPEIPGAGEPHLAHGMYAELVVE